MPNRPSAVDAARHFVACQFPHCLVALASGSAVRGDATETSDIDLVVLTARPDAPFRASYVAHGWPIEAFVHTPSSLRTYFAKDIERRRPSIPRMCADGVVVAGDAALGEAMRAEARALLTLGPPGPTADELVWWRYELTDALDDLIGSLVPAETAFIASEVAVVAAQLTLLCNGRWLGSGKWTHRELVALDPGLAAAIVAALRDAQRGGSTTGLIDIAEAALAMAGGRLFEGCRRSG